MRPSGLSGEIMKIDENKLYVLAKDDYGAYHNKDINDRVVEFIDSRPFYVDNKCGHSYRDNGNDVFKISFDKKKWFALADIVEGASLFASIFSSHELDDGAIKEYEEQIDRDYLVIYKNDQLSNFASYEYEGFSKFTLEQAKAAVQHLCAKYPSIQEVLIVKKELKAEKKVTVDFI
jgi:hypothetical protein